MSAVIKVCCSIFSVDNNKSSKVKISIFLSKRGKRTHNMCGNVCCNNRDPDLFIYRYALYVRICVCICVYILQWAVTLS